LDTLLANVDSLRARLEADPGVAVVADVAGYRAARADGRIGCFLAVQGGNAVRAGEVERLPPVVSRETLVHLTPSALGRPSSPVVRDRGLTAAGREYVEALDARRVVLDLAHAGRRTFWDALDAHDPSLPTIVSHTGVRGIHDVWRNIDDDQVRAIAATGGVVGVMYHCGFIGGRSMAAVVAHIEHVIDVGGEDCAALGSDWDGLIVTPRDMPTVLELPALVACMRARGFSDERVAKVVGGNYLRAVQNVRG
ncbi:MAG: rane dipeptidase, partial [Actinomycetota bacterium]|nr:rane dipeptidase [Actinomycetota bacterium]